MSPTATSSVDTTPKPAKTPERPLHRIPWPETPLEKRKWQLEQMAGAFRIFAKLGFADGASGHISLRGKKKMKKRSNRMAD
jgi:hypothetical protein